MAVQQIQHGITIDLPGSAFRDMRGGEAANGGIIGAVNVDGEAVAEEGGVGRVAHWPSAAGGQQGADEVGHFAHQAQMVVAAAIPFEQHEFAPVLASLFFTTKDVRQLVNITRTRCQQDF